MSEKFINRFYMDNRELFEGLEYSDVQKIIKAPWFKLIETMADSDFENLRFSHLGEFSVKDGKVFSLSKVVDENYYEKKIYSKERYLERKRKVKNFFKRRYNSKKFKQLRKDGEIL